MSGWKFADSQNGLAELLGEKVSTMKVRKNWPFKLISVGRISRKNPIEKKEVLSLKILLSSLHYQQKNGQSRGLKCCQAWCQFALKKALRRFEYSCVFLASYLQIGNSNHGRMLFFIIVVVVAGGSAVVGMVVTSLNGCKIVV